MAEDSFKIFESLKFTVADHRERLVPRFPKGLGTMAFTKIHSDSYSEK